MSAKQDSKSVCFLVVSTCALGVAWGPITAQVLSPNLLYTSIQPCRLVDTRMAGGALQPGVDRTFNVVGVGAAGSLNGQGGNPNGCPVPPFADVPQVQAVVLNVVAVSPSGAGDLRAWPTDQGIPGSSIINYSQGVSVANAVVLPVRQDHQGSDITVLADVSGAHLVADILGYFTASSPTGVLGADNLFLGVESGNPGGNTGANETALGSFSLKSNTSGTDNAAVGASALATNTGGSFNTAVGALALQSNVTGGSNTAVGFDSMQGVTSGGVNAALGINSLESDTTGMDNTAIGAGALSHTTGGSSDVALGFNAGSAFTAGESFNIDIGNTGTAGESNTIRIGTIGTHTAAFIAGVNGNTSSGGTTVFINGNGQLGTLTSSLRFKQDVQDMDSASDRLLQLRPVTFHYRPEVDDGSGLLQYGLIAEEVAQVDPGLVQYDGEGRPAAVRYHFVNAMLLNELQKQRRRIAELEAQMAEQRGRLALQDRRADEQEARLEKLEARGAPQP